MTAVSSLVFRRYVCIKFDDTVKKLQQYKPKCKHIGNKQDSIWVSMVVCTLKSRWKH